MANVTQILDRAARITGLRTEGSERELALEALNDAYIDVCMQVQMEQRVYTHNFDNSQSDYDVERHEETDFSGVTPPFPTLRDDEIQLPPTLRIVNVVYQDGSNSSFPLLHASDAELLEYRRGYTAQGFSRMYSMAGTGIMRLWPRPANNDKISITYVPLPPELTEGTDRPPAFWDQAVFGLSEFDDDRGAESTPSQVPIQFHWNTLLAGAVVQLLDKDQRMEQVGFWQNRYEAGIEKMMMWHAQYGGDPTPIFDRNRPEFVNYPDQWNRRY